MFVNQKDMIKVIYRFNVILVKIQREFFSYLEAKDFTVTNFKTKYRIAISRHLITGTKIGMQNSGTEQKSQKLIPAATTN